MKIRALVLALWLACAPAWAARWVEVVTDASTGTIFYLDVDSLYLNNEGDVNYWIKTVFKNLKNIPGQTIMWGGQKVWYGMALKGENCTTGEVLGAAQAALYGMQGQILASNQSLMPRPRAMPIPDSVGEELHETVCLYWQAKQYVLRNNEKLKSE